MEQKEKKSLGEMKTKEEKVRDIKSFHSKERNTTWVEKTLIYNNENDGNGTQMLRFLWS